MLTHLEPQDPENGKKKGSAKYPVKRRIFWPDRVVGGWGGGPSLLRRGEKRRSAMPRPGGPWPDWGWWVGVAGRLFVVWGHILELCWHILGAMLPQLEVMSAHVGAMLAHLGAMLAHLAAYVGPC